MGRWESKKANDGLPVAELATGLSGGVRTTIHEWPFDGEEWQLRNSPFADTISPVRRLGRGSIVLIGAVVAALDRRTGETDLRIFDPKTRRGDPDPTDFRLRMSLGGHGESMAALQGLVFDACVRIIGDEPEGAEHRKVSDLSIYGVERPVRLGDTAGVLRGEVTGVVRGRSRRNILGGYLVGEGGNVFQVRANPEASTPEIWSEGNIVALRVVGGTPEGEFSQPSGALPIPLQHAVLLQPATL